MEPEENVVTTASVPAEQKSAPAMTVGYTVGLMSDGHFKFEILGDNKGLVELLGVNAYANKEVQKIHDNAVLSGDRLSHELGQVLNLLNQKLDQLTILVNKVTPIK
jgi:hypothetical protein